MFSTDISSYIKLTKWILFAGHTPCWGLGEVFAVQAHSTDETPEAAFSLCPLPALSLVPHWESYVLIQ